MQLVGILTKINKIEEKTNDLAIIGKLGKVRISISSLLCEIRETNYESWKT